MEAGGGRHRGVPKWGEEILGNFQILPNMPDPTFCVPLFWPLFLAVYVALDACIHPAGSGRIRRAVQLSSPPVPCRRRAAAPGPGLASCFPPFPRLRARDLPPHRVLYLSGPQPVRSAPPSGPWAHGSPRRRAVGGGGARVFRPPPAAPLPGPRTPVPACGLALPTYYSGSARPGPSSGASVAATGCVREGELGGAPWPRHPDRPLASPVSGLQIWFWTRIPALYTLGPWAPHLAGRAGAQAVGTCGAHWVAQFRKFVPPRRPLPRPAQTATPPPFGPLSTSILYMGPRIWGRPASRLRFWPGAVPWRVPFFWENSSPRTGGVALGSRHLPAHPRPATFRVHIGQGPEGAVCPWKSLS